MRYTTFGPRTGLRVSELARHRHLRHRLGLRRRARRGPPDLRRLRRGRRQLPRHRRRYPAASEKLVGEFIAGDRDRFVVATKYTRRRRRPRSHAGNSRKNMVAGGRGQPAPPQDRLHRPLLGPRPGRLTPIEEILRGLDDLVRAGQGPLRRPVERPRLAGRARARRSPSCAAGRRSSACRSSTAWSSGPPSGSCCRWPRARPRRHRLVPLGGGLLTGKYRRGERRPADGLASPRPRRGGRAGRSWTRSSGRRRGARRPARPGRAGLGAGPAAA